MYSVHFVALAGSKSWKKFLIVSGFGFLKSIANELGKPENYFYPVHQNLFT